MKKIILSAVLLACLTAFCVPAARAGDVEEGFVSIFNGKDLTGWTVKGGSGKFSVVDGVIVGECVPDTPHNTFLCTEKEYGDFILRLEYKMEVPGNSGIQFRSHVRQDGDQQRVFGYQAEMDSHNGGWTGKIYDEGRRGHQHGVTFLDKTPQETVDKANATLDLSQWTTLEIQCVGPSIRTWINGVAVTNMFDYYDLSGIFGFQVHAGKEGKILWRNIRIRDLGKSEWKSFFVKGEDGKMQLVDARFVLPEEWSFDENGDLHGVHKQDQPKDGLVVTNDEYADFVAKVTYRMTGGNSALYFRAHEVNTPWLLRGFQNEIAGNARDSALWHTAGDTTPGRGWVATNDDLIAKVRNKMEDWNTTCTAAYGDRLVSILNGFTTVDIIDPECEKTGKLGLQLHGNSDVEMWFKDFEVIEFTEEMKELINRE